MSNENSTASNLKSLFASAAILLCLAMGICIYVFILGDPSHFDAEGHPKPGDFLGMMHKGGWIVPILMSIFLIVITFSIERGITISKSKGKGRTEDFVRAIRKHLNEDNLDAAIEACDKQQGSLANVVKAGVQKYKDVRNDSDLDKESKVAAVQKELEDATSLELPMLSKNLPVITTMASISTLWGLIGTVIGMIRAFAALSAAGAPDTTALATGISEALINTALGVGGSVIGIMMYNYFSTKIDALTYSMDEASFSIINTVSSHK